MRLMVVHLYSSSIRSKPSCDIPSESEEMPFISAHVLPADCAICQLWVDFGGLYSKTHGKLSRRRRKARISIAEEGTGNPGLSMEAAHS